MKKKALIDKILAIELDMFKKVPTPFPTRCQESPKTFRLVRGSAFEAWSERTLDLYLQHLCKVLEEGRNLMTEKYARMDGIVSCLNLNPIIDDIIKIQVEWAKETHGRYPHIFKQDIRSFAVYLRSELETYSDPTLESYFDDLSKALHERRNLVQETYTILFKKLGYSSLEEAEQAYAKK